MSLPEWLEKIDKLIFLLVNHDSDHKWLDSIMIALREPLTWIPLYLFILFYVILKAKNKSWHFIIVSLLTFAFTDSMTSRLFKPIFARLRPCFDTQLHGMVRSLVDCGGLYSFPSSHAANHFGLAACWIISIQAINGKKWHWLWVWAFLISYAQIYVGKHFPIDILGGAVFGVFSGTVGGGIFKKWAYPSLSAPSGSRKSETPGIDTPSLLPNHS